MDWETLFKQNQEDLKAQKLARENREVIEEVKKSNAEVVEGLDNLSKIMENRFTPKKKHWYQTGEITIASATAQGTYPEFKNLITDLGYPSTNGIIHNTDDTGNIFVAFSKNSSDLSVNEIKILPGGQFEWGEEQHITEVIYVHLRTDTNNTTYQIVAT